MGARLRFFLFCSLPLATFAAVVHAEPLNPSAAAPTPKPRGIWFWWKPSSPHGAANVVGQPERETEALVVFQRWQIGRVYGSYATLPVDAPEAVAAWNRRLHAQGIRSESLFSNPGALTPDGRVVFLREVAERVMAFNQARQRPEERFDGVVLDIEPHAIARWKDGTPVDRRGMLEEYLMACAALRAQLDAMGGSDLTISAALAYWLDRLPPEGRVGWKSARDRDDWFGRLAKMVPAISLMAYERSRAALILDAGEWERANFPGRTITALRARLGVEWKTLADLQRVLPEVEAASATGIDLENYELLRTAEIVAAGKRP